MAKAYQVLARKWRPQLFAELAGLEHIARTLQNAIRLDRVGHAFLFTGSRGVGKTSAARVLAKALNCVKGPAVEPCNQCENCIAVTACSAADVIEIDGASNRGVGEIRLLRENITYLPQSSPYKIYIIDEVHMLTTEAFNALLKTLEEPPAHVKFIMATTDVHKVPMTILSRCQRFDFGRLTGATIAATLVEIGERENLTFGSGTVELLAREAQGSMRDALSLLDQARSYAGETIAVDDLRSALGLIEARHSFALLEKVVTGDLSAAVSLVNDLEQAGVDLKKFSEEFLFYLRDALFLKLSRELKGLLGISADEIELLEPLVAGNTLPYWRQLFDLWQEHYSRIKLSQTPRLALEMALIELGMARDLQPVEELLGRIDRHLKIAPGALSGTRKGERETVSKSTATIDRSSASMPESRSQTQVQPPAPGLTVRQEVSIQPKSSPFSESRPPVVAPSTFSEPSVATAKAPLKKSLAVSEMPPEPPPQADFDEVSPPPSFPDVEYRSELSEPVAAGPPPEMESKREREAVIPQTVSGKVEKSKPEKTIGELQAQWDAFLERLAGKEARLGAMLQRSRLQPSVAGTLLLEVAPHALALLDEEKVKQNILSFWNQFRDRNEALELQFKTPSTASRPRNAGPNGPAQDSGRQHSLPSKEVIFNDPAIRFISDRFGGRVTEIKPR